MRTDLTHLNAHLPHHASRWWIGHAVVAVVVGVALLYGAAVLLVLAGRLLL
jgi:hypothetical protein